MTGTTISHSTITSGITFSTFGTAENPITVASGVIVKSTNASDFALYAKNVTNANWTLTNYGTISGGTLTRGADLSGPKGNTLLNHGTIVGENFGVYTGATAVVTNFSGGVIAAYSGNSAVALYTGGGTFTNAGVVLAKGTIGGHAVVANNGVYLDNAPGTVINQTGGTIAGTEYGVRVAAGGSVTNASGGTIVGNAGVGLQYTFGTVENAGFIGTISGGTYAVKFGLSSSSNHLITDPGASFVGAIYGGDGELELAVGGSGVNTLSNTFGAAGGITNFGVLDFDGGAEWKVVGAGTAGFGTMSITGFASNDTIEITGFAGTVASYSHSTGLTLSNGGTTAVLHITGGGHSAASFGVTNANSNSYVTLLCFARGTQIATPDGEVSVERLAVGDLVRTLDGTAEPIVWIGTSRVHVRPGRRNGTTPIIVHRDALAPNVPYRDLRVTKGHSLYLDDVLIPVEFLVNHRSICWDDRAREIDIYHVELARHAVLIADGAPAESYRDDGNRWIFGNADERQDSSPTEPCAPVLTGGPVVDAIWRRLLDRAGPRPGVPLTDEPDLHLLADGRRVDGVRRDGVTYEFRLATTPRTLRIVSRAGSPAELGISRDLRCLGVAIRRIVLRRGERVSVIEADDDSLADGFHLFEAVNGFRWTDGDALVPARLLDGVGGALDVSLCVGATTNYVDDGATSQAA